MPPAPLPGPSASHGVSMLHMDSSAVSADDNAMKIALLLEIAYNCLYCNALVARQVQEMHEQAAAQTAEVRKLYDWRDVMKTVHSERLQELAAKHHADRDSLLNTISQRSAIRQRGLLWDPQCCWLCQASRTA